MADQTIIITDPNISEGIDNEPVGAKQNYAVDPVKAPVEDACQVKFTTWPPTGTAITNEGLAGAGYNGVAGDNDYALQSTGATSFVFNDVTDSLYVPHGAVVDNLGAFTFEYGLYWNAATTNGRFFSKNNFLFYITSAGVVWIVRYDVGNVAFKRWYTTTAISVGGYYHIQIAWDSTNVANSPVVKINNVTQTLGASNSGTTTAWSDDSATNFYLESEASHATWYNGTIYSFRLHNRVLSDEELTRNYNAEKWRFFAATPYETGCNNKWGFEQASGAIIDYVGGLNLTNTGCTYVNPNNGAGGYRSAGAGSGYLYAASPVTLADTFTIEIHVMKDSTMAAANWSIADCSNMPTAPYNGWRFMYDRANNYYGFQSYNAGVAEISHSTTAVGFLDGTGYQVTHTYNRTAGANNFKSYVNGRFAGATTQTTSPITDAGHGVRILGTWFKGTVYLVRIYNGTVLTPAQIQQNYEAEKWRYYTPITNAQDTVNQAQVGSQTRTCVEVYSDTTDNEPVGAQTRTCVEVYSDTTDIEGVGAQTLAASAVNVTDTEDEDGVWGWNYTPVVNVIDTTDNEGILDIVNAAPVVNDLETESEITSVGPCPIVNITETTENEANPQTLVTGSGSDMRVSQTGRHRQPQRGRGRR